MCYHLADSSFLAMMEHGALSCIACGFVSHLQTLTLVSCQVFFSAAARSKTYIPRGNIVFFFYHAEFKQTLSSCISGLASHSDPCTNKSVVYYNVVIQRK